MEQETNASVPTSSVSAPLAAPTTDSVASQLNRADIVLTRGGGLTSRVIRWFTHSYWNHAAIVFVVSDVASGSAQGYQRTFILEAESRGVDAHPIDKYLYNENQDMAILRFPDSALPAERRVDFLRRARGFALEEIDAAYGYGTILRIAERILGPVGWLLKPVIRMINIAGSSNRERAINALICSGVVQYAYFRACFGADPAGGDFWDPFFKDAEHRHGLIVSPEMRAALGEQGDFHSVAEQLKMTTPADFSRAVADNLLECVAARVKGAWARRLTKV